MLADRSAKNTLDNYTLSPEIVELTYRTEALLYYYKTVSGWEVWMLSGMYTLKYDQALKACDELLRNAEITYERIAHAYQAVKNSIMSMRVFAQERETIANYQRESIELIEQSKKRLQRLQQMINDIKTCDDNDVSKYYGPLTQQTVVSSVYDSIDSASKHTKIKVRRVKKIQ